MGATETERRRFFTRVEVGAIYDVDPKAVDRWADSGQIPSVKTPGGQRKYPAAEIAEDAKANGFGDHPLVRDFQLTRNSL